jgi:hypothetical protein
LTRGRDRGDLPPAHHPNRSWVSRGIELLVRRVGDGLEVLYFNCQVSQDRRRQREHRLPPSRGQLWAGMPKVVARLGCQPVALALDLIFVGHEGDYGAFYGLRLSLAVGGSDILNADRGALG